MSRDLPEYIKLSTECEEFKHLWQIEEEKKKKEVETDALLRIKMELNDEAKAAVDERILRIRLKIKKDPKNPENYLEFCRAEVALLVKFKYYYFVRTNFGIKTSKKESKLVTEVD